MRAKKAPQKVRNARRKWVEALRSGKFKQANGVLWAAPGLGRKHETFCCLGVYCRLVDPKFPRAADYEALHTAVFPENVRPKSPIPEMAQGSFAALNDDFGWSFKRIATLIEKNIDLPDVEFEQAIWAARDAALKKRKKELSPW